MLCRTCAGTPVAGADSLLFEHAGVRQLCTYAAGMNRNVMVLDCARFETERLWETCSEHQSNHFRWLAPFLRCWFRGRYFYDSF